MLKLERKEDLQRLVDDDIQESLTLDYKRCAALGKANNQVNELCKDVSAFANSAGGQIVYGIVENGHHPVQVQDIDGVDPTQITREWIEQVIDTNVHPRIAGLSIHPIEIASGRFAYVITIPSATTYAPHMASDKKYYYRQNFQSVPMEDYQVAMPCDAQPHRNYSSTSRLLAESVKRLNLPMTAKFPSPFHFG